MKRYTHFKMLLILFGPGLVVLIGMTLFASMASGAALNLAPGKTIPSRGAGNSSAPAGFNPGTCSSPWSVVSSPNPGTGSQVLNKVAALSANDVWAVGYYANQDRISHSLIEHWNGTAWSVVSSPDGGIKTNYLTAVAAVSANDVWAVGYYTDENSGRQTLAERWNGTTWSIVPSLNPAVDDTMNGIVAISSTDVWTVGTAANNNIYQTLIEHWNGSAWSVVPSPDPGSANNLLLGVAAVSANDMWAVGYYNNTGSAYLTLTEHWNGTAWSVVSSPSVGSSDYLYGVAAVSATDVWAVGVSTVGSTLTEHWNGTAWSVVPSPSPGTLINGLSMVAVVSANDVWASGTYSTDNNINQTLVEHWNGTAWSVVPSPSPGTVDNYLQGVSVGSANDVWVVGYYTSDSFTSFQTLTEHYSASGCPTPTPGITTPTPSPSATPATCTNFSDVPPGSTYYPFVTCLVGRHIINGYQDCTFHPSNNVTRGQFAKIVSLAAGFSDPPGSQLFQDVAPGSTFYTFVQQLASRGFISGYPCGGPGEPCGPGNLPYFRPNNDATRGQIAKIVVNTAVSVMGWTLANPTTNTFQDVVPGTTYYRYVETAYAHGVIGGYTCGSAPARPCVPPANKPYFVPNNNATRGQTAKIVTNTFFPNNCQASAGE